MRTTDGTMLTFEASTNNEMRCRAIENRNGNLIFIGYDGMGHINTITDTLGRTINFVYVNDNLDAINQTRNGTVHPWARFTYGQALLSTNFPGLTTLSAGNNVYITVLTRVDRDDGSSYRFSYTTWGQVYRIAHHAPDGHQLSYTSYNLAMDAGTAQTDCPRFTEQREWAEEWNGLAGVPPEVVTSYSVDGGGAWSKVTMADGTVYKETYATTGWQRGLTLRTDTYASTDLNNAKKWTTTQWTQDDPTLGYQSNPRPVEINVYDAEGGRRRRTHIDYRTFGLPDGASCSLPSDVYEYEADGQTVRRRTHTDYVTDSAYLERRIIGLAAQHVVTNGGGALYSKTSYEYDWGEHLTGIAASVVQHDANFNTGHLARGNLVDVIRYDVNDANNANGTTVESKVGYDTNGSVVWTRDALGHQTTISYADSFADGVGRNTFAYPTVVTDAGGYTASSEYSYDIGQVTRQRTPQPNTTQNQLGPEQVMAYDAAGRITRVTNLVNNSYTRWEYPENQTMVKQFSTITDGASEVYSAEVMVSCPHLTSPV